MPHILIDLIEQIQNAVCLHGQLPKIADEREGEGARGRGALLDGAALLARHIQDSHSREGPGRSEAGQTGRLREVIHGEGGSQNAPSQSGEGRGVRGGVKRMLPSCWGREEE